jgi:hypothetical protein
MKKQGRRRWVASLFALGCMWSQADNVEAQGVAPTRYPEVQQVNFRRPLFWRPAPGCCPTPAPSTVEPIPVEPKKVEDKKDMPPVMPPVMPTPTDSEAFAQLSPAGGTSAQSFSPNMFGDQFGHGGLSYGSNYYSSSTFVVPNPAGGGVVGRTKVSEDSSPLPRDRFIFNYDYFHNVPLRAGGQDVNRFTFGVEKTCLDGMASVEVRLPFASTLDSDIVVGGESTHTELGNLHLMIKGLLWRNESLAIASGLGISLPTADDTRVITGGSEIVHIRNRTVGLEPYFAALWTPNERLFSQLWVSVPFDTVGNKVDVNPTFFAPTRIGTLHDQTRLVLDGQIGYWLMRSEDPDARLRGVAPFAELHYTTTTSDADVVSGGGLSVGDLAGRTDELNLTLGVVMQIGDNATVSVGGVIPLSNGDNRLFDYQIGVRAQVLFGATARDRSASYRASVF